MYYVIATLSRCVTEYSHKNTKQSHSSRRAPAEHRGRRRRKLGLRAAGRRGRAPGSRSKGRVRRGRAARAAPPGVPAPEEASEIFADETRLQARAPRRAEPEASSSRRPPRPAVGPGPAFFFCAGPSFAEASAAVTSDRSEDRAVPAPRPAPETELFNGARDTSPTSTGVPSVKCTTFSAFTAFAARVSAKRTNPNRRLTPVWTSCITRAPSTAPQCEKNHTRSWSRVSIGKPPTNASRAPTSDRDAAAEALGALANGGAAASTTAGNTPPEMSTSSGPGPSGPSGGPGIVAPPPICAAGGVKPWLS